MRTYIRTFTGRKVYPLDLTPDQIDVRDIAHALAMVCRFTGHTRHHYSVAQHSIYVSRFVPWHLRLTALLHDASEAYIADIARPIKHTGTFDLYRAVEDKIERAVAEAFGTVYPMPPEVKEADQRMLATEIQQLMNGGPDDNPWANPYPNVYLDAWLPAQAEEDFLYKFHALGGI
jgi:hypothetical protein